MSSPDIPLDYLGRHTRMRMHSRGNRITNNTEIRSRGLSAKGWWVDGGMQAQRPSPV